MPLKRITLIVLICWSFAFCISFITSVSQLDSVPSQLRPRIYSNLAVLILRDVSLISLLVFLYRRSK